jgi:hypothetical protein
MKKIFLVLLACVVLQGAAAQETTEGAEQGPGRLGLSLGAALTLSDVMDELMPGIRVDLVFDKTLGGLHLYGNVYDKVLKDDRYDLMRQTHFEEEIGYRFGITRTASIGVFINNVNDVKVMVMTMPASTPSQTTMSSFEGLVEPGLKFDGAFPFGMIQAAAGIPILYRSSSRAIDADPLMGFHPEISWQSNFGLGVYGGASFAFPPGSNDELTANETLFERTEWKISYMVSSFYFELALLTALDFSKVNVVPTITWFSGPLALWLNFAIGKININYTGDFGVCPTAGLTYSF